MLKIIKSNISERSDGKQLFTFLNPFSYLLARNNKEYFREFNIMIDGMLLVKLLKFIGIKTIRQSFDMTSLAPVIFNNAINNNEKIFIVGTFPGVIDKTVNNIRINFPNIQICGYQHGYIPIGSRDEVLNCIVNKKPDIVICGMGAGVQEKFLLDLKKKGWNGKGYTCGGFLHQSSETLNYYPYWINLYNLRWLYRFYKEPHVRKRILVNYPIFFLVFFYDCLKFKFSSS